MYVGDDDNEHVPPPFYNNVPWNNQQVRLSWDSTWHGLSLYYYRGYVVNPRLLYCPAQPTGEPQTFEYYDDWPHPGFRNWGNAWVTWVAYDQIAYWGFYADRWLVAFQANEYVDPSYLGIVRTPHGPQLPYIHDLICNASFAQNFAHKGKWNVLFIDGHVSLYAEPGGGPLTTGIELSETDSWPATQGYRDYLEAAF
jgi:prepilin-type processing-associated H-X9-DG protein